jgi:mRNA-degrading endonuclease RelE of RelBE toxin-antitoxin system
MMKIRISDEFKTAYKRLKKRHKSLEANFEALLISLQENPYQGVEIHEEVRKIRMNITSKGRGKSGGARVIVRVRIVMDELQLLYIYDKADFANVSDAYLRDILKRMP